MMGLMRKAIPICIYICIGMCIPFLLSNHKVGDKELPESKVAALAVVPSVPSEVHFADEVIKLDRADLRERMDREITAFTYSHQLTLLMIKRANRYFPIVEPILKECGVPDDLKYLMVIESNLSPLAKSPAGAAGMWQFMQATGRKYGLEVNENIDERYNLEKATRAACAYLKESYEMYGDWMTVAASYNAGQNGISRRLEQQGVDNAMDLWLVEETSRYMFRILTAKEVLENPKAYGFMLRRSQLYPYIPPKRIVTTTRQIDDLTAFAKEQGVTVAQLKEENPWLREYTMNNKSGRTYRIRIPDVEALHYDPNKTKSHNPNWTID
ncbi:MAG: lytic transglycosylase domain-containing protein [Bacteroidaceae bacterium]|nr:lytic transglycosylase domain-containing protein [Bacteroidaceae bacterium]